MQSESKPRLSLIRGAPFAEEPGLGALTLPGYLREVTTRFAAREALVLHEPGGEVVRWSYAELGLRAEQVARALVACGLGKGERVGVLMTNRPEWLAAVFGAGIAGGVAAALSTFSTRDELAHLLEASGVSILLFEGRVLSKDFAAILRELEPGIAGARPGGLSSRRFPYLRQLAVVGDGSGGAVEPWRDFLARGDAVDPARVLARAESVKPADAGLLLFSSGSTGKPKGVLNAHRGVAIQCWRFRRVFGLGDDVRCWAANGFFWSGNFGQALGATLSSGGCLVLQPTFEPEAALELVQRERVTYAVAWPHQWAQLEAARNWASADLSSLRYADPETPAGRHPSVSARWTEPTRLYGNTETFTISTSFPPGTTRAQMGQSSGEPLPGNVFKIVDPLTGAVVARGLRGEIAVKGPTLMLGYVGIPNDEVLDDEGFFRTGDAGTIDERGWLFWEGRLTDIIKTGGANVSPAEVDRVLADCPGVKVARTVGVPHETLGEMVVACVVPQDGARLEEASVRDFARARLSSYKAPRRVLFIREDELSLTGSAKVKAQDLRELAAKRLAAEAAHQ
jgi:acyl-CoA synthetase (AMP-forming)/AMP-acid ligase II